MKSISPLLIVDGHNLLFRGFYGVPEVAKLPSGLQVNAVFGFFAFLRKMVSHLNSSNIIVVFDTETGSQDKIAQLPEYKANREDSGPNIFDQLPIIKHLLDNFGIQHIEDPNNEADDVMATIAAQHKNKVKIFSHDHDFRQLLSENISIVYSKKGTINNVTLGSFENEFQFLPNRYTDYLALKGDPSDNIKGISGIGPVTAKRLINEYGHLEGIYENIIDIPKTLSKKLMEGKDEVFILKKFFTMNLEIPTNIDVINEIEIEEFANFGTSKLLQSLGY